MGKDNCRSRGKITVADQKDIPDSHDPQKSPVRKDESLIDEAKRIQFLLRNGLTIPQIADTLTTNQKNVRTRRKLFRLTLEEQHRVHVGKLGMVNAIKLVDQRDQGKAAEGEAATDAAKGSAYQPSVFRKSSSASTTVRDWS